MGVFSFVKAGKKIFGAGKAIKSVKPNVPKTKLEKLKAQNRIATQRLKGAEAKLKQTQFEIKNPKTKKDDKFTFEGSKKKTESNKERFKRIQKENTKVIKKFIAPKDFAKGGRVEYKKGTPNPFARKSKLKKIQEAFKTTPSFMVKKEKPKKRLMAKKGSPDPKKKKKFPDLTGDGKVTFADILKGRGVINGKKKTKKKII